MNAERVKQIVRCVEEIHRCEKDLAGDKTGTGAWLGYMDWIEALHGYIWEEWVDNRKLGIGGAPTRATTLPTEPDARKQFPVASGFLDYFPDAVCAVANLSYVGNLQHNGDQPLHWARGKSTDEADTMMRHFLQRGTLDTDGVRHSVKMVWRALAFLQKELEQEVSATEQK